MPSPSKSFLGTPIATRVTGAVEAWCLDKHTNLGRHTPIGALVRSGKHYGNETPDPAAAAALARQFQLWVPVLARRAAFRPLDSVVAIPSTRQHPNLPSLLAAAAAATLDLPFVEDALERGSAARQVKFTPPEERSSLLAGAFRAHESWSARRVLLVDDLIQTGATAAAAIAALGSQHVVVLAASKVEKGMAIL